MALFTENTYIEGVLSIQKVYNFIAHAAHAGQCFQHTCTLGNDKHKPCLNMCQCIVKDKKNLRKKLKIKRVLWFSPLVQSHAL